MSEVISSTRPMMVATNLTDLHREPSWIAELLTQIVNGQPLDVLEESGKWARVRQPDGYTGWAYLPYLTDRQEFTPTHSICAPSAELLASPERSERPATVLLGGTAVTVDDVRGTWMHIKPAGNLLPAGWAEQSLLRPVRTHPAADARAQIVADAKRLTGVYYLWGGASPFGLDCSGLAQLTHRLSGYTLPRDAYMQFNAAWPVEPPYQGGDLLFFHSDTDASRITHVGISVGGWRIIHSSRGRNGVYEDDVQSSEKLRNTFVSAKAFVER